MRGTRTVTFSVIMLLSSLAFSAPSPVSAQSRYHSCTDLRILNEDGTLYTRTWRLKQSGTSCVAARRLAYAYLSDDGIRTSVKGYYCTDGTAGPRCRLGKRRVKWNWKNS